MSVSLEADYFCIGAGAMGMAFVDIILKKTSDKTIILVDDHMQPGGHWNDAYPYVTLHQPSTFYGVDSLALEKEPLSLELASKSEILAYYQAVIANFIKTGRLKYFPMCRADSDLNKRTFRSLTRPGLVWQVGPDATIVDATYMKVRVPSKCDAKERYHVGDGVQVIPLNGLSQLTVPHSTYVVVGAGKTGIDACLWLLKQKVEPEHIYWVMPRDSWLLRREFFDVRNLDIKKSVFTSLLDSIEHDSTVHDFHCTMEKVGMQTRLDPKVTPLMNKCGTVSAEELNALRQIKHVIRLGHVTRLKKGIMVLENGQVTVPEDTLYVDCSTNGLARRPATPVFTSSKRITLQSVSICQQVFSAALVAFVEVTGVAHKWSDERKNSFCIPVPHPDTPEDYVGCFVQTIKNKVLWLGQSDIKAFVTSTRLHDENHVPPLWETLPWLIRNLDFVWMMRNPGAVLEKIAVGLESLEGVKAKL